MGLRVEQVHGLQSIPDIRNEVSEKESPLIRITEEYSPHSSGKVVELPIQKKYSTLEILKSRLVSKVIPTGSENVLPVLDEQYQLLEILGSGGMANVFKVEKNGSYYALKILKDELLDEKRLSRFKNEMDVMKKLSSHPYIISIINSGEYMGRPCIVEEFANDKTLREKIKTIHPNKLIQYMVQISRALHFVHENGYIHRDLKPENIFLTEEIAKLGDFGITKSINSSNLSGHITSDGIVLGTLAYMSPEEARQALEPEDNFVQTFQSDIYSIGVIIYEGLTGQLPIPMGKNNSEKISIIALLRKISTIQPQSIYELNSNINTMFGRFVCALLEKTPQKRFEASNCKTALQVAEVLEYYLSAGCVVLNDKAA